MSTLERYWPTSAHATECLPTEAETVDDALLLAVHAPTLLLRRAAQSGLEESADEVALLNELMRPVTDGSAVVVAITGASGVGKSHMVRWLGAQLERHPRRDDLVVVSIPKGVSLRGVVELILKPLITAEYEVLRRELARASEALTPSTAAELLAAALGEGLKEYRERTVELVKGSSAESVALRPHVAVAEHARNLILAPEARELWLGKVLLRIVGASLGGTTNPSDRQFCAEDLEPPQEAVGHELPHRVQMALAFLGNANGRYRSTAATILQEVLDSALRTVFRITEALQQKSIPEVIDDIRRQLLKEDKELVLLIEDLSVLSGIQQPLLDIMVIESNEHGRRVRAPIRTAVAVTDGFLAGRQTVLTRATEQWVVPSEGLSENTIVSKLVELTGRYLNAARWGVEYLQQEFSNGARHGADLYAWVPRFEEPLDTDAAERLDAFGRSQQGYPLFPFNELAIRGLAETALKLGSVWTYNPRAFINQVLRKTLAERPAFLDGAFPPPGFKSPRLVAEVRTDLQRKGYPPVLSQKLEVALHFWAGSPVNLASGTAVPKPVFEAFSLPWPFDTANSPVRPSAAAPTQLKPPIKAETSIAPLDQATLTSAADPIPVAPDISAYAEALEAWTPTNRLPNAHARDTRGLLQTALESRLDLGNLCLKGQKIDYRWFWLPPMTTANNPNKGLVIQVALPDDPIPPGVLAGLKALARWEKNAKSWCYANAETDYAAADALLNSLECQVLQALTVEAECDAGMMGRTLHVQSLLLGLSTRGQPDNPSFKELFAPGPDESMCLASNVTPSIVRSLEIRSKAIICRTEIQDRMKQLIGCFQGTGNKMMGIDSDRLKRAWKTELPQRWVPGLSSSGGLSVEALDVLERVSTEKLPALVKNLQSAVQSLLPLASAAFESDHARVAWRDEMRLLVQEVLQLSVWPSGVSESEIRAVIDRLSQEGIESVIQRMRKMSIPSDDELVPVRLAAICAVPLPRLSQLACDVDELNGFFDRLGKLIDSQTRSVELSQAIEQREELTKSLEWES